MNILIVRLGALGDIVHAVPAAAALRHALPGARIDWLVEARHRPMIDLVSGIDQPVVLERPSIAGWLDVARRLRAVHYDVAIDFQGLMKSAVLARASGASRVIGFSIWHVREKGARPFYSEIHRDTPAERADHIVRQNLALLRSLGINDTTIRFPLVDVQSRALEEIHTALGGQQPFALINPGAAWPNKRWPPDRFGEVAAFLREVRGLTSFVLWGPGEEGLAGAVVETSGGAARVAPPTRLADLLALSRAATLMVSGDTGPLHIAAAVGTPTVSVFGPTDPQRNGPWNPDDVSVSRYGVCACHYERRCRKADWCLGSIGVPEVTAAVQQRFQR
jgi:lipopolysaccharide heptosyltransferase I